MCHFSPAAWSQSARLSALYRRGPYGHMQRREFITLLGGAVGGVAARGARAAA